MIYCLDGMILCLWHVDTPEDGPQREVVSCFECSGQDEGQS